MFDFCRFCVVIRFFHPRHNGRWPPTSKDFYPRFYPLHILTILILEKEPVFLFFQYWVPNKGTTGIIFIRSYNVFGMTRYDAVLDWGLNPGPLPHSMLALYLHKHTRKYNKGLNCTSFDFRQLKYGIIHNKEGIHCISSTCKMYTKQHSGPK